MPSGLAALALTLVLSVAPRVARAQAVSVSFRAPFRAVALYRVAAPRAEGDAALESEDFRWVCEAPCETSLPRGLHYFAISRDGGFPQPVGPHRLTRAARLRLAPRSRDPVRVTGVALLVLSAVGWAGGLVGAFAIGETVEGDLVASLSLPFGSVAALGLALLFTDDGLQLQLE